MHTELEVKFRIVRKTTNTGKGFEDRKGQRHRCRSNLRPCRPRLEMHLPSKREKWKRKGKKKIIKCREEAEAPA